MAKARVDALYVVSSRLRLRNIDKIVKTADVCTVAVT
jgi:hypothetical protein